MNAPNAPDPTRHADTVCEWGGCSEPLYRGSRYCREHTTQILNPPQDAESVPDWLVWLGYGAGWSTILGVIALIAWRVL